MKVFLDTNILLDVLNESRPSWADSTTIIEKVKARLFEAVATTQSIVDSYYIAPKSGASRAVIDNFIFWLSDNVNIRPVTVFDVKEAIRSGHPDFEDAVQVACAEAEGCDVFVTGDRSLLSQDWNTSMLIITPEEFVNRMRRQ
jgi:predicted nucleic acid-binding protein